MVRYFWGEDTYGARQAIEQVAADGSASLRWLDRDDFTQVSVADVLQQGAGLFGQALFVIRDPSGFAKPQQEDLLAATTQQGAGDTILWERGVPDKRGKLWRAFRKSGERREFAHLSERALQEWLQEEAHSRQGKLEVAAARQLVARAGVDRWRLVSELERLLLAAGGDSVTARFVEESTDSSVEAEIFDLLDALVRGDRRLVVRHVNDLLAAGSSEFYLLSMLAYQFRTLLTIAAGQRAGKSSAVIAREARLHPFVVQKQSSVARRFHPSQLLDALTRIAAVDVAIKQGRVEARTGLLMLVMRLAEQANTTASRASA